MAGPRAMVTGSAVAQAIAEGLWPLEALGVTVLAQVTDTVPVPAVLVWEESRSWVADGVQFASLAWAMQLRVVVPRTPNSEELLERILAAIETALGDEGPVLPEPVGGRYRLLDATRQTFLLGGAELPGRVVNLQVIC